jgi:hypothetical protein
VSGVGCRARLPQVGLRVFTIALLVFGQPFTSANLGVEIAARQGCGLWRKVISASDCLTDLLDGGRLVSDTTDIALQSLGLEDLVICLLSRVPKTAGRCYLS